MSINPRTEAPEPVLPPVPAWPPPDPGPAARVDQIQGAIERRQKLRSARERLEQAQDALKNALASLATLGARCSVNPPSTDPTCTPGRCSSNVSAAQAILSSVQLSITDCGNKISEVEQEFEARGGPPDPSEATIQQLNGDADAVAGCGDQVVQQVQTAIQNANAALGGCPGGL